MARMKYTTSGKRSTDPRRRQQPAQPVIPMEIKVIELSDDAAPTVEVAHGIEVSDATPTQAEEVEVLAQPNENMLKKKGL